MSSDASTRHLDRTVLPPVLIVTALGVLTFSLITPALPDLARELGVSRGLIGFVQGAVAIPGIFLAPFIGYIADRRGRRFVAVASLLVYGVGGVAGFFLRSFWPLVLARALQGMGTSGILSLGVVVIGDVYPAGHERRRALGINSAALTLTGMVSPVLGGWLASGGAFRPFLVFAIAFPAALLVGRLPGRPEGPPPRPPLRHLRGMFRDLAERGRKLDFIGLLPFSTFVMVVFAGFGFTVTPLYLERVFGVGSTGRGIVQAALSVGSSTGALASARLVGRLGARRVLDASFALVTVGFVLLAVAPGLVVVAAALVMLGLGIGIAFPVLQDFVASSVSDAYRGAAVGSWISAIRLGQAGGPVVGTGLADSIGERTTYVVAGAVTAFALVAWHPLRMVLRRLGISDDAATGGR